MRTVYRHTPTGAQIDLTDNGDGTYEVNRVFTPREHRQEGGATAVLTAAIRDADRERITLRLWINPYGDMNRRQLAAFYRAHGFTSDRRGIFTRPPRHR